MCHWSTITLGEELVVITMLLLAMIGRSGVELFTRSLLIGWARRLALSKVVAPLVLLSHTVHQKEDEEDGKQEANHSAGYNRCTKKNDNMSKKIYGLKYLVIFKNTSYLNASTKTYRYKLN